MKTTPCTSTHVVCKVAKFRAVSENFYINLSIEVFQKRASTLQLCKIAERVTSGLRLFVSPIFFSLERKEFAYVNV